MSGDSQTVHVSQYAFSLESEYFPCGHASQPLITSNGSGLPNPIGHGSSEQGASGGEGLFELYLGWLHGEHAEPSHPYPAAHEHVELLPFSTPHVSVHVELSPSQTPHASMTDDPLQTPRQSMCTKHSPLQSVIDLPLLSSMIWQDEFCDEEG